MEKKRIISVEGLHFIASWVGITYFYYFLTWGTFSNHLVPNVLTEFVEKGYSHIEVLLFGVFFGISFAWIHKFTDKTAMRRKPFGYIIFVKSIFYLLAMVLVFSIISVIFFISGMINKEEAKEALHGLSAVYLVSFIAYFTISIFLFNAIIQINRKFGPGVLSDLIKGKYHQPHEEERVFMFLDLKGSTAIAEQLGHLTYSRLIQNCFFDLSDMVLKYKAHIYQYVGDEVVLSWDQKEGLENLDCFKMFLAYDNHLEKRKPFYLEQFGVFPTFKAGLDAGKVTVAEIGELKREIAYHGDVLNTASRIEGMCNSMSRKILFSENIVNIISGNTEIKFELMGEIQLRGKEKKLNIFSLKNGPLL